MLPVVDGFDDGADLAAERLHRSQAAMPEHHHVAAVILRVRPHQDGAVLPLFANGLHQGLEGLRIVLDAIAHEGGVDHIGIELDNRFAFEKLVGAVRQFVDGGDDRARRALDRVIQRDAGFERPFVHQVGKGIFTRHGAVPRSSG